MMSLPSKNKEKMINAKYFAASYPLSYIYSSMPSRVFASQKSAVPLARHALLEKRRRRRCVGEDDQDDHGFMIVDDAPLPPVALSRKAGMFTTLREDLSILPPPPASQPVSHLLIDQSAAMLPEFEEMMMFCKPAMNAYAARGNVHVSDTVLSTDEEKMGMPSQFAAPSISTYKRVAPVAPQKEVAMSEGVISSEMEPEQSAMSPQSSEMSLEDMETTDRNYTWSKKEAVNVGASTAAGRCYKNTIHLELREIKLI